MIVIVCVREGEGGGGGGGGKGQRGRRKREKTRRRGGEDKSRRRREKGKKCWVRVGEGPPPRRALHTKRDASARFVNSLWIMIFSNAQIISQGEHSPSPPSISPSLSLSLTTSHLPLFLATPYSLSLSLVPQSFVIPKRLLSSCHLFPPPPQVPARHCVRIVLLV